MVCKTLGEKVLNTSDIKKVCDLNSSKYINNKKTKREVRSGLRTKFVSIPDSILPQKILGSCAARTGKDQHEGILQYNMLFHGDCSAKGRSAPESLTLRTVTYANLCACLKLRIKRSAMPTGKALQHANCCVKMH